MLHSDGCCDELYINIIMGLLNVSKVVGPKDKNLAIARYGPFGFEWEISSPFSSDISQTVWKFISISQVVCYLRRGLLFQPNVPYFGYPQLAWLIGSQAYSFFLMQYSISQHPETYYNYIKKNWSISCLKAL